MYRIYDTYDIITYLQIVVFNRLFIFIYIIKYILLFNVYHTYTYTYIHIFKLSLYPGQILVNFVHFTMSYLQGYRKEMCKTGQ